MMRSSLLGNKGEHILSLLFSAIVIYLVLIYIAAFVIPADMQGMFAKLGLMVSLIALAIIAYRFRSVLSRELVLLALYGLWYIAVFFFRGKIDSAGSAIGVFNIAVMSCAYFAVGGVLPPEERRTMLLWLCSLLGAVLLFLAVCGLIVALTNESVIYIPRLDCFLASIEIMDYATATGDLVFFDINRNASAPWFLVGLCSMMYLFAAAKKPLVKTASAITALVFFNIISLQHCRSVTISTAVVLTMLVMIYIYRRIFEKKVRTKAVVMALTALAGVICFYGCIYLSSAAVSAVAGYTIPRHEQQLSENSAVSAIEAVEAPQSDSKGSATISDPRGLENLDTLDERIDIWKAIIPAVKDKPTILLWGTDQRSGMAIVNRYTGLPTYYTHMHNMFLQVFQLTGLPGLILYTAFCVLLLIKMIRYFFSSADVGKKSLILLPSGLFLYGSVEIMAGSCDLLHVACFYLFAGAFAAYYRDDLMLN